MLRNMGVVDFGREESSRGIGIVIGNVVGPDPGYGLSVGRSRLSLRFMALTRYRSKRMIFPMTYRSVIRLDGTCGLRAGWRGYAGMGLVRG